MCSICRTSPCHRRCPNTDLEYEPFYCPVCGDEVHDTVYKLEGEIIGCDQCVDVVSVDDVAEVDGDEEDIRDDDIEG